ncbi:MAG: DUF58 domain-containing protein [Clostridia bacterium]|nr:DUF58 domain-containing protein [Clostridia bacterium]
MPFSKRFALLVLAGVAPLVIGSLMGWAFHIFIIYNSTILLLLILDFFLTPGPRNFEVSRQCEEKFSLGAENMVAIKVRNSSRYLLKAEFRDTVPNCFKHEDVLLKIQLVPHHESIGIYAVVPQKRGQFSFGSIFCRYDGVLGLCSKSGSFAAGRDYKVYPNIRDLRRYTLSALKKSQLIQGVKKVKTYGMGTEFESLREYTEGDDYRKINWLATARAHKLIVNTYEPERNQQIFILLDASRVMNSEINFIKKLDYAINSSFLFADFAIRKGDNIGLLVFDSSVKRYIKPGKGMAHFQLIAENLYNVQENMVTADYKAALTYLNQNHKRRSLLLIFTELFNSEEALNLAVTLKSHAKNHMPVVITINDTRIEEKAESDVAELEDVFIKTAAIRFHEEREKVRRTLTESGVAAIDAPPDKLSIEVLNKYLSMKTTV